ncbi:MAG TPA: hypothetical protein VNN12_07460 [Dehalococcoidia bacterium]|nr:hypothetical protein [Dehalococcoidia bacterium]
MGIHPVRLAALAKLREDGRLSNQGAEALFDLLCGLSSEPASAAEEMKAVARLADERGLLVVRDDAALARWLDEVFAANPKVVADVRAGKTAAAGRLVGEVMKLAGGKADARLVREEIMRRLGG